MIAKVAERGIEEDGRLEDTPDVGKCCEEAQASCITVPHFTWQGGELVRQLSQYAKRVLHSHAAQSSGPALSMTQEDVQAS